MHGVEVDSVLDSFVPIQLKEMDEVLLMNRVETKYVFSALRLPHLLKMISDSYQILEIDAIRNFPYHTTYFDTPDLLFYNQQVRGKLNRHKVRYRIYETTGHSFLEIKKRTNKNRTIKWRIQNNMKPDYFDEKASAFMSDLLPYTSLSLSPVLINGFTRITLVCKELKERITLDYDISFGTPEGTGSRFPFLAIAEIKRDCHACFSPVGNAMKQLGIKPNRFSKYCMGSALMKEVPRKNSLKRNLILINKIENEYIKST
jgi:hypothetical protein